MANSQPQRYVWEAAGSRGRSMGRGELLQNLRVKLRKVRSRGDALFACCPAHEDNRASLSVSTGDDGRILLYCFAGCSLENIVAALGLKLRDLFPCDHQHRRSELHVVRTRRKRELTPPDSYWAELQAQFSRGNAPTPESLHEGLIHELAADLGVSYQALTDIEIGHTRNHEPWNPAYTIPERDGLGRIVGIALRYAGGFKSFIRGGNRGLVIPASVRTNMPSHLYAVEGMTDCAALLTAGLPAVARASCTSGARELFDLLRDHPETAVTIIGDRDGPGRAGGLGVQSELQVLLKRPVGFGLPPEGFKDVRAALIGGAL